MRRPVSPIASGLGRWVGAILAGVVMANCNEAVDSSGPVQPSPVGVVAEWRTYADARYGFSVRHPKEYVILPETVLATRPATIHRVRFQDEGIARGALADREPARFSIELFERSSLSLRTWLQAHDLLPASAVVTETRIEGATESLRVALRQQLAPNEFVYLATDRHVYRLTPLGEHSQGMLTSFRISR